MTAKLEQLHSATLSLASQEADGDTGQWNLLIGLRDEMLSELSNLSALTEKQKQMIREICEYDSILLQRMESVRDQAAASLEKLNQSKLQKNVYGQTYDAGSYFIDKRK